MRDMGPAIWSYAWLLEMVRINKHRIYLKKRLIGFDPIRQCYLIRNTRGVRRILNETWRIAPTMKLGGPKRYKVQWGGMDGVVLG